MNQMGLRWGWSVSAGFGLAILLVVAPCRAAMGADKTPAIEILTIWPESPASLAPRGEVHIRFSYSSAQPLRFQAASYLDGKPVTPVMRNPSPVYPPGDGEAVVWLACEKGARIDELRVMVHDEMWERILEVSAPAQFHWDAPLGAVASPRPDWVMELNRVQQAAIAAGGKAGSAAEGMGSLILWQLLFLMVPGYFPLQGIVLWRCWRRRRMAALLPLLVMGPALVISIVALTQGSNLWPIWMILLAPPCFLYLLGVLFWPRRTSSSLAVDG